MAPNSTAFISHLLNRSHDRSHTAKERRKQRERENNKLSQSLTMKITASTISNKMNNTYSALSRPDQLMWDVLKHDRREREKESVLFFVDQFSYSIREESEHTPKNTFDMHRTVQNMVVHVLFFS